MGVSNTEQTMNLPVPSADRRLDAGNRELEEANHELEQKNKMLEKLALTDPLTSLPNRRAMDRLAERGRRSRIRGHLT